MNLPGSLTMQKIDYYSLDAAAVLRALRASLSGLSKEEATLRLKKYGRNVIEEKEKISRLKIFLSQFKSFIMGILVAAVAISVTIGNITDAVVIAVILIGNALFGFVQEYRAEQAIAALKKLTNLQAKVKRSSQLTQLDVEEVVPGDILMLETGDRIAADGRLLETNDFEVTEATLTGESTPVAKNSEKIEGARYLPEQKNMVFSGTLVTQGRATAVVTATGRETELGKIAILIEKAKEKVTPLQKDLAYLGRWLGVVTIVICALIFLLEYLTLDESLIDTLMAAISLAVAAIPEGLPAVVTISLALGVQRMARKNTLIRKMPSVETLGCCSVICADKTGTLTHNQMTVRKLFVNGEIIEITGEGYSLKGSFSKDPEGFSKLLEIGALCNNASLQDGSIIGDPTEGALLVCAEKAGLKRADLEKIYQRVDEIPFDAKKKYMVTFHRSKDGQVAFLKGAPETVIELCAFILIDGEKTKFSDEMKERILQQNDSFAHEALRVLGFAFRENNEGTRKIGNNFTFVGLQAMIDPPRREAFTAIQACKRAGIKVIMITGDYEKTAVAIAERMGIEGEVLSVEELEQLKDLKTVADKVGVYTRVAPEHKLKIIQALRASNHVIAMTGDGVNDAPALKSADIGIAIGSGTDVAKEASDMILMDDNFSSIVKAVEEGRVIYDNIKKFVNYLLSSNLGEVMVLLLAALFGWPLPLLALQILWINLITDGLPALALGVDPGNPGVMKEKPRRIRDKIMGRQMNFNVAFMGVLIASGTLFIFHLYKDVDIRLARTMAFTTLVVLEIVRVQIIRMSHNEKFFSNSWLVGALALSMAMQLAVIYTPLSSLFHTASLDVWHWVYILVTGATLIILSRIVKFALDFLHVRWN